MRVNVSVTVNRDDGTTLSRSVSTETQRVYQGGSWANETKAQLRLRVRRLTEAAIVSTLGR